MRYYVITIAINRLTYCFSICENKDLLFEEMPSAYKEIENIVSDLQDFGLVSIIAVFKPLITYKTRVVKYNK